MGVWFVCVVLWLSLGSTCICWSIDVGSSNQAFDPCNNTIGMSWGIYMVDYNANVPKVETCMCWANFVQWDVTLLT